MEHKAYNWRKDIEIPEKEDVVIEEETLFGRVRSIEPVVNEQMTTTGVFSYMLDGSRSDDLHVFQTGFTGGDASYTPYADNPTNGEYTALTNLISQEYSKAIEVEPNHYNIHFATSSVYLGLASYDPNNLEIARGILKKLEELSPNSVQTLEIKIRIALLMNDPITAEPLIENWRKNMPEQWKNFWDHSLGIIKGEIIPEWETNCRNEEYPIDKPAFEDSNILRSNELDNGVIVGIKQEILDNISPVPSAFSRTTDAAVSSQLVSIPKKVSFSFMLNTCL